MSKMLCQNTTTKQNYKLIFYNFCLVYNVDCDMIKKHFYLYIAFKMTFR